MLSHLRLLRIGLISGLNYSCTIYRCIRYKTYNDKLLDIYMIKMAKKRRLALGKVNNDWLRNVTNQKILWRVYHHVILKNLHDTF